MTPPKHSRIFMDTNAIAAAVAVKQWHNLKQNYQIETVRKCVEEALRPNRHGQVLVDLPEDKFIQGVKVHEVDDRQRFELMRQDVPDLDDGELDLLAFAQKERDYWWLCGPDRAAIRALHAIGKLERSVSLERLIQTYSQKGKAPKLEHVQTEAWLSKFRMQLQMDGENMKAARGEDAALVWMLRPFVAGLDEASP